LEMEEVWWAIHSRLSPYPQTRRHLGFIQNCFSISSVRWAPPGGQARTGGAHWLRADLMCAVLKFLDAEETTLIEEKPIQIRGVIEGSVSEFYYAVGMAGSDWRSRSASLNEPARRLSVSAERRLLSAASVVRPSCS